MVVFEFEILVREGAAIDGLSSSAIVIGKVSSLCHEIVDDAMEVWSFVAETFFVSAECSEVGCSFGCLFIEEFEDKFACLLIAEIDFKEDVFECHKYL